MLLRPNPDEDVDDAPAFLCDSAEPVMRVLSFIQHLLVITRSLEATSRVSPGLLDEISGQLAIAADQTRQWPLPAAITAVGECLSRVGLDLLEVPHLYNGSVIFFYFGLVRDVLRRDGIELPMPSLIAGLQGAGYMIRS